MPLTLTSLKARGSELHVTVPGRKFAWVLCPQIATVRIFRVVAAP
jgi:hypothetical protein